MEQAKYDVFISYSRKDYVDAQKNVIPGNPITAIQELFEKNGISYWFDKDGIYSGQEFIEVISNAIAHSKMLVFVSSKHSNASMWTTGEIFEALDGERLIIPVRIDDSPYNKKFKLLIRPLDYVDYMTQPNTALSQILRAVINEKNRLAKIEEEKQRQQLEMQEEARKATVKKEIKERAKDYLGLIGQEEYILKELYAKNKLIGNTTKRCPVCEIEVSIQSLFCTQCGWLFPKLYGIDGDDIPLHDESHLSLARTIWQRLNDIVELQAAKKALEETNEDLKSQVNQLNESFQIASRKIDSQKEDTTEKEFEIEYLKENIASLEKDVESIKEEKLEIEEKCEDYKKTIEAIRNTVDSLKKEAKQKDLVIIEKEKKLKETTNTINELRKPKPPTPTTERKIDQTFSKQRVDSRAKGSINEGMHGRTSTISLDEAFSMIEKCCDKSPIQDNFPFNKAQLRIDRLQKILEEKYSVYLERKTIAYCRNIGNLKQLIHKECNKS